MKRKVIIIIPAAVALALGIAGSASAHTPSHNATCQAGLSVSGSQYNGGKVTLQIGTSSVQHTFTGGSFSYTLPNPDKTIVEAWKIVIDANDGNEFDVTYQGTLPACQQTTTTQGSTTSTSSPPSTSSTTTLSSTTPSSAPPTSMTGSTTTLPTSTPITVASSTTDVTAITATSSPGTSTPPTSAQAPPSTTSTVSASPQTTSSPTSTEPLVAVGAPPKPPAPQTELPATGTETTAAALLAGLVLAGGTGLALIARRRA